MANVGELRRQISEYNISHMYSVKTIVMGALVYAEFKLDTERVLDYIKDGEGREKPYFDGIPIEIDYQNRTEIRLK